MNESAVHDENKTNAIELLLSFKVKFLSDKHFFGPLLFLRFAPQRDLDYSFTLK